jgi:hypothetical protein
MAIEEIRRCKGLLKVSGKGHYLRDNSIASLNLEDYLRPSIWCWHPQRLLASLFGLILNDMIYCLSTLEEVVQLFFNFFC